MMDHHVLRPGSERGSALLITLGILLVVSLIAMTSIQTSRVEIDIAGNMVKRSQALLVAEAGLAQTDAVLRSHPKQQSADTLMQLINATPHLSNASFSVAMESALPLRKVISVGRGLESEAAVQVTYRYGLNPHNIWNNVLFAGHGQDGKSIRGNTGIHGSVHILGNGELFKDLNANGVWDSGEPYTDANHDGSYDFPLTPDSLALNMTGSSFISNNYAGMPAVLSTRVPPLPVVPYAGESVQSLSAELRVQHGYVSLDGSANVGFPNSAGGTPAIKETLDAVWVNDGWGGSAGTGSVHSDNGYQDPYDFDEAGPSMPNLDAPYVDKDGVSHPSYMSYLQANALVIPGDLQIRCGSALPLMSDTHGMISVDGSGSLVASGVIYVQGNIDIIGECPIEYSGRFTLVSEGDTHIDTDFYSNDMFATKDVAGIVSYQKLELGVDASQLRLAGAFFAQEEVSTAKQTQIAGSVVSNFFDLQQVPDIYQVPELVRHLPPGMPGADDFYVYSWRRVPNSWTELY